jgi:hypothetical protein
VTINLPEVTTIAVVNGVTIQGHQACVTDYSHGALRARTPACTVCYKRVVVLWRAESALTVSCVLEVPARRGFFRDINADMASARISPILHLSNATMCPSS